VTVRRPPVRTCVACRRPQPKASLIRIVRRPDGLVVRDDPRGRTPGRGAYLCDDPACWTTALRRGLVARALRVSADDGLRAILTAGPRGTGLPAAPAGVAAENAGAPGAGVAAEAGGQGGNDGQE
jgi:hypothetical protein